ncbi:MAG: prolyl oligopeptidase family serine peptidase [Verrucomicrobiota bacterium]
MKGFPPQVQKITYPSSADQSQQPALFFQASKDPKQKRPLLVALHTWSGDYSQGGGKTYARWCIDQGWSFIHPNFRGPNWTPEAMGSDLAVADIISAVEYAKKNAAIDENRIYLIGVSGGGHASLLMAGRAPDIWAGVSAWCGISDIAQWHNETKQAKRGYWKHIEKSLGGDPNSDTKIKKQADHRSPLHWLDRAQKVNLDINHGITDGRSGSVPFSHSLHAFNQVLPTPSADRITDENILAAWTTGKATPLPQSLPLNDPLYGTRPPVYRKTSGNTRITLFQGGHEIIHLAALNWLANQRKGQNAIWDIKKVADLKTSAKETQSGK